MKHHLAWSLPASLCFSLTCEKSEWNSMLFVFQRNIIDMLSELFIDTTPQANIYRRNNNLLYICRKDWRASPLYYEKQNTME